MNEKIPGFSPEEQKKYSERGGYVSGQSRRGEIQRGESGEWELTEKGKEDLHEKALEEDTARGRASDEDMFREKEKELLARAVKSPAETGELKVIPELEYLAKKAEKIGPFKEDTKEGKEKEFIPGPAAERAEEKQEAKEEIPEELKNAYFEWRDLERKAKGGSAWTLDISQEAVLAAEGAKEKYHQLLFSLVSEKGKPFYLPEEMAPEGGPKKFNEERLEKMVQTELGLEKEYEKKVASESEANEGIFKKLWRGYAKTSRVTKLVLSSAVATGAIATVAVFGGSFIGLGLLGVYGAKRLIRSAFGAAITASVYAGFEKYLQPFIDKKAASIIEKTKQEQIKNLNDIRVSEIQAELLRGKENLIKEHHRMEKQKRWLNIEKAVAAGLVGGTATLISGPLYESVFEKSGGGAGSAGAGGGGGGAVREIAGVPPVAGKVSENLIQQEQYFGTIDRGGNIWKAAREIAKQAGLDDKQFGESWHNSFVDIPGRGRVHISEVNLVHPGTEVYWDGETEAFYVKGEGMGPSKVFYGEPRVSTETAPGRPFDHLPVEPPELPKALTFAELEKGYPGVDADKFVSERLESFNIDPDYYDKIKNSKVSELLKIRQGTFWDLFRHLNDETAGQVDIHAEWKLAVMVKTELKNLLSSPFIQNLTIDEALKFAALNRHQIIK